MLLRINIFKVVLEFFIKGFRKFFLVEKGLSLLTGDLLLDFERQ